jgi:predicted nuclease of restriction endonuclease-like (RecB) superfamily
MNPPRRSNRGRTTAGSAAAALPARRRLLSDVRQMIVEARESTAQAVNVGLIALHWSLGERIRRDVLTERRAGYGDRIVYALSRRLTAEFGRGFSDKNLHHMIRFAETFPDRRIVSALGRQLSWTHFRRLIYLDDPLVREFYAEMCRIERWSTRILDAKIQGMLFERTAISRKPAKLARKEIAALRDEDRMTPDLVFRDPYILDFLGLTDAVAEKDLEAAILRDLESFLLEMGVGFTFVARQKRITVDGDDHHLDLLFFHRRLRRLVAVELKLGRFRPADKGQMELYLRWLDAHERGPDEGAPIGLILCAGKSAETVELLRLEASGIRVAEYLVDLPPRGLLERKLHQAIAAARRRFPAAQKLATTSDAGISRAARTTLR